MLESAVECTTPSALATAAGLMGGVAGECSGVSSAFRARGRHGTHTHTAVFNW